MVSKFCSAFQVEAWADDVDTVRFTTDWEDDFDAVGIAKCCQCGLRLPIDHDSIEHHSRSCAKAVEGEIPRVEIPRSAKSMAKEWLERPWRNSDAETTCYSSGLEEESGVSCDREATSREVTGTDDVAPPCVSYDQVTEEDADASYLQDRGIEDWEDGFDAIGIGKCSHCGSKLPLDDEAIDRHLRECQARAADSAGDPGEQFGNCCRCGKRISLDPEAVIAHSQRCLSQAVPPPPSPPKKHAAARHLDDSSPGRPLALSAGCFSANASLFGGAASGSDVLNRCIDVAEEGSTVEAASILSSWSSWRKPWARQAL
mmetsp:Transcript_155596/g.290382  ORF Transcript_155596/g.290382 Transcript_155596/m.290382 type:complete len:315 (-) Transcript_155596:107-1051(-)